MDIQRPTNIPSPWSSIDEWRIEGITYDYYSPYFTILLHLLDWKPTKVFIEYVAADSKAVSSFELIHPGVEKIKEKE